MARRIPKNRFEDLVRLATEVFIARGFRLTQMSDVAKAVGVAKGTLYGYVESKDALLLLCLQFADEIGPIPLPEELPIKAPPAGSIGAAVKAELDKETAIPVIEAAMESDRADDIDAELTNLLGELFDLLYVNRRRIKLLDRCMDHPELGELWQSAGREQIRLSLARYVESRIRAGQIREVPDLRQAVRIVIETCTTWAIHIHWDRAPEVYEEKTARANVIEFLAHGLTH